MQPAPQPRRPNVTGAGGKLNWESRPTALRRGYIDAGRARLADTNVSGHANILKEALSSHCSSVHWRRALRELQPSGKPIFREPTRHSEIYFRVGGGTEVPIAENGGPHSVIMFREEKLARVGN